jgi:molecular chaperone DnaK
MDGVYSHEIRNRVAELSVAMQKIGQAMYEAAGANGAAAAPGAGGPADEDVVDGEYKVD